MAGESIHTVRHGDAGLFGVGVAGSPFAHPIAPAAGEGVVMTEPVRGGGAWRDAVAPMTAPVIALTRGLVVAVSAGLVVAGLSLFCAGLLVGLSLGHGLVAASGAGGGGMRLTGPTVTAAAGMGATMAEAAAPAGVDAPPPVVDRPPDPAPVASTAPAPVAPAPAVPEENDPVPAAEPAAPAPDPQPLVRPTLRPKPAPSAGAYAVQVGAFLVPGNAEAASRALAAKGLDAYRVQRTDRRGRTWHLVRVGRFGGRGHAVALAGRLGDQGTPGFVVALKDAGG